MRAFIGQVLGKCFEAPAFLIMNPQVAFGAPDGWPAYSRTTHGICELAGVLQDIQPKPRSHELCFSHVYMKTLGFQSLLPRLDTFNTFLKRSSNDHEIICKEQLPGHPHPKISSKSEYMILLMHWKYCSLAQSHQNIFILEHIIMSLYVLKDKHLSGKGTMTSTVQCPYNMLNFLKTSSQ